MASRLEEKVLTHRGRRHYRKRYSGTEVRYSVAVFFGLAAITAWVSWRGAHPDPSLFEAPLDPAPVRVTAADQERGPLPQDLAPDGFAEEGLGTFDAENLYVKINGRAGYFKSFGFQRLWALSLVAISDPIRVIDIEIYDLALPANALGAFSGELPEGTEARTVQGGLAHRARNTLLMTRGQHFVRALGSDEGSEVKAALQTLEVTFEEGLLGSALPWSHALFAKLGAASGEISFFPENAFSFGFARDVHIARLPDGATEVFVHAAPDTDAAKALASRFNEGFQNYGEAIEATAWAKDRYLGEVSGAVSEGAWVLGVRAAPDLETADATLLRLRTELLALPPEEAGR